MRTTPGETIAARGQVASTTTRAVGGPHETSMAVWDVPSPIAVGARVKIKVGLKCSENCPLRDSKVGLLDAKGVKAASARLGPSPLAGTVALYWAEVEFDGPSLEGYSQWTACFDGDRGNLHEKASLKFGLTVAKLSLRRLTIRISDSSTKQPLENAYVRVGPQTLFSDKDGVAKVSVPEEKYELVAWKRNHQMFRTTVDVGRDEEMRVELNPQPCKYCPDST